MFAHKCAISTRLQETLFKLLTNWYSTPIKIRRWFPTVPDLCWHCNLEKGTLQHIWWECTLIQSFWRQVSEIIKLITETQIQLNAACCLLHINNCSMKKYKRSLTRFLHTAAKAVIPRHWRNTTTPTIQEWLEEVHLLYKKEIRGTAHEATENFDKTWQP